MSSSLLIASRKRHHLGGGGRYRRRAIGAGASLQELSDNYRQLSSNWNYNTKYKMSSHVNQFYVENGSKFPGMYTLQ